MRTLRHQKCTICNFPSNSGRQTVLCFSSLVHGVTPKQMTRPDWMLSRGALTLTSICAEADDKLLRNVLYNEFLHPLLPPCDNHHSLRSRTNHIIQLPSRTSSLNERHFFIRYLFEEMTYSPADTCITISGRRVGDRDDFRGCRLL